MISNKQMLLHAEPDAIPPSCVRNPLKPNDNQAGT